MSDADEVLAKVERDRLLRAIVGAAQTLISELDSNPIGEYGDAVCEAIDVPSLTAATFSFASSRSRAALEVIAVPPHEATIDMFPGCAGCAGIAQAALAGELVVTADAREAIERGRSAVEAERDRLRAALHEVYFHLGPPQPPGHEVGEEGVPALVRKAMAERDQLRAVVEATGDTLAMVLAQLSEDMSDAARILLIDAVEQATAALDVSGAMGVRRNGVVTEDGTVGIVYGTGSPLPPGTRVILVPDGSVELRGTTGHRAQHCPDCGGAGCDECGGTGDAGYGRDAGHQGEARVRSRPFRELSAQLDQHPDIDRLRAEAARDGGHQDEEDDHG